jgi:hypothetical protein
MGFETILFGVWSSDNHYNAPVVHSSSTMLLKFFSRVMKKPAGDLAMALEAYCLLGVSGESPELRSSNNYDAYKSFSRRC